MNGGINFTFILSLRPRPPYQGSPPWKTLFPNWHKLYDLSSPPMLSHILGQEENQNFHCIKSSERSPAPGSWPIYLRMEVDSATVRGPWVITCNIYKSRIWKRVKGCGRFTGNFLKGSAGSFQCWPLGFIFSGDFCQTQYYVPIKQSHSFTKKEEEENTPPEQIEADFFMGNFGCLQKKYGSPVQHNSHEVWTLKS